MATKRERTLLDARKGAGLTQQELAAKAGVSQQAISDIETGTNTNPSISTVRRLEAALRCALKFSIAA